MRHIPDVEQLNQEVQQLREQQLTLSLAVQSEDGWPECSYAPFIPWQNDYVMMLSGLASHTQAIERCPDVGVLLIEDEAKSATAFARRRLVLRCQRKDVDWSEADRQAAYQQFEARHGKLIRTLKTLPDFRLVTLSPCRGRYIRGFGQAFELTNGQHITQTTPLRS